MDSWFIIIPTAMAVVGYLIRIEQRLTKIATDICWLKKEVVKCPQP